MSVYPNPDIDFSSVPEPLSLVPQVLVKTCFCITRKICTAVILIQSHIHRCAAVNIHSAPNVYKSTAGNSPQKYFFFTPL